ncbi:MAG TPA: DUF4398 domain-containing protein [Campylobacteraceae bacterium]|nr:DUF4398 domain-containing protein [Campylobacteraceae bacterium]
MIIYNKGASFMAGKISILFTGTLAVLIFGGCAGSTPPVQDLKIAKMALLDAEEAKESKRARDYFQRAQKELIEAQKKMETKAYEEAGELAQKATADARLAKVLAENDALQQEAEALEGEIRRLRREFTTIEEEGSDAR